MSLKNESFFKLFKPSTSFSGVPIIKGDSPLFPGKSIFHTIPVSLLPENWSEFLAPQKPVLCCCAINRYNLSSLSLSREEIDLGIYAFGTYGHIQNVEELEGNKIKFTVDYKYKSKILAAKPLKGIIYFSNSFAIFETEPKCRNIKSQIFETHLLPEVQENFRRLFDKYQAIRQDQEFTRKLHDLICAGQTVLKVEKAIDLIYNFGFPLGKDMFLKEDLQQILEKVYIEDELEYFNYLCRNILEEEWPESSNNPLFYN